MKHYPESMVFASNFDHNAMAVGDTFDHNFTRYTVERKFTDGPFMKYTKEAKTFFVVSFFGELSQIRLYTVCTWSGDWEGCHPISESIEGAIFSEMARLNEILDKQEAEEAGRIADKVINTSDDYLNALTFMQDSNPNGSHVFLCTGDVQGDTEEGEESRIELYVLDSYHQGISLTLYPNGLYAAGPCGG